GRCSSRRSPRHHGWRAGARRGYRTRRSTRRPSSARLSTGRASSTRPAWLVPIDSRASMTVRFCPQCGTQTMAGARVCHAGGTSLVGGAAAPAAGAGRRTTVLGASVLGGFLVAGLAIWTVILSPTPPKAAPGSGTPRTAQAAAPSAGGTGDLPAGHPAMPTELPPDVKEFIADLGRKAKDKPDDPAPWLTLARVTSRAARIDSHYG